MRIRGAIADELRRADWLPRHARESHGATLRQVPLSEIHAIGGRHLTIEIEWAIDRMREVKAVNGALRKLPKRSRMIVKRILSGDMQSEIAEDLGFSEARISQIVGEAVAVLRAECMPGPAAVRACKER